MLPGIKMREFSVEKFAPLYKGIRLIVCEASRELLRRKGNIVTLHLNDFILLLRKKGLRFLCVQWYFTHFSSCAGIRGY